MAFDNLKTAWTIEYVDNGRIYNIKVMASDIDEAMDGWDKTHNKGRFLDRKAILGVRKD